MATGGGYPEFDTFGQESYTPSYDLIVHFLNPVQFGKWMKSAHTVEAANRAR